MPDPNSAIQNRGYGFRYGSDKNPDTSGWGSLPPLDSPVKGKGYFGMMQRFDDPKSRSSEVSIGVTINGQNYHVPSLVPTLTQDEVNKVLSGSIPATVAQKATDWAKMRLANGMPIFATPQEEAQFKPLTNQLPMDRSYAPPQMPMGGM